MCNIYVRFWVFTLFARTWREVFIEGIFVHTLTAFFSFFLQPPHLPPNVPFKMLKVFHLADCTAKVYQIDLSIDLSETIYLIEELSMSIVWVLEIERFVFFLK